MNTSERFLQIHEYMAAGMFEECDRSLFYRKALGIRRYYENCPLYGYNGEYLYPSGIQKNDAKIVPHYLTGTTYTLTDLSEVDKELLKEFEDAFHRYSSSVPKDRLIHLYTPRIEGKERRKAAPSAEGVLGVEGMENELLYNLFLPYAEDSAQRGAEFENPLCKIRKLLRRHLMPRDPQNLLHSFSLLSLISLPQLYKIQGSICFFH